MPSVPTTLVALACLTVLASAQPGRISHYTHHWTGAASNIQDSYTNIADTGSMNSFTGGSVVGSGNATATFFVSGDYNTIGAITITGSENATIQVYISGDWNVLSGVTITGSANSNTIINIQGSNNSVGGLVVTSSGDSLVSL
jgi:hypothetical protein